MGTVSGTLAFSIVDYGALTDVNAGFSVSGQLVRILLVMLKKFK